MAKNMVQHLHFHCFFFPAAPLTWWTASRFSYGWPPMSRMMIANDSWKISFFFLEVDIFHLHPLAVYSKQQLPILHHFTTILPLFYHYFTTVLIGCVFSTSWLPTSSQDINKKNGHQFRLCQGQQEIRVARLARQPVTPVLLKGPVFFEDLDHGEREVIGWSLHREPVRFSMFHASCILLNSPMCFFWMQCRACGYRRFAIYLKIQSS